MRIKDIGLAALGIIAMPFVAIGEAIAEAKHQAEEERRRREAPCEFTDGISEERFRELIEAAKQRTPRVTSCDVNNMTVTLHVKSQSGLTEWEADVDFSDFGHLTGRHWIRTENDDSLIPEHFAKLMKNAIEYCHEGNSE